MRQYLDNLAPTLQALDLRFYKAWASSDQLSLALDNHNVLFPSLEILSLSNAPLRRIGQALTTAFNLCHIRSLKLCVCSGTVLLIQSWIESGKAIRLQSLMLIVRSSGHRPATLHGGNFLEVWTRLLESFQGLIDLSITTNLEVNRDYLRSVLVHRATLQRFVHQMYNHNIQFGPNFLDEHSRVSVMAMKERLRETHEQIGQILCSPLLRCVGITYPPYELVNADPFYHWP